MDRTHNGEGFHPFDQPEWKNKGNSLSDPEKRCPECGGLKKRTTSLCGKCSRDPEINRQYLRQFNFRQMMQELRHG